MKNMGDGSGAGLQAAGAVARALPARQRFIRLTPASPSSASGYVWRRIFLKGRAAGQ